MKVLKFNINENNILTGAVELDHESFAVYGVKSQSILQRIYKKIIPDMCILDYIIKRETTENVMNKAKIIYLKLQLKRLIEENGQYLFWEI